MLAANRAVVAGAGPHINCPQVPESEAEAGGISERSATMLRTIARLRPDLVELIPRVYTINAAYRIARGEEPTINSPNSASCDRLVRAWNTAGEVERERFCQELGLVEGE